MAQIQETPLFLDSSLKAYWKFEGNSNDSTTNAHNGTDTSVVYSSAAPKFGQYASLDGSSSYISVSTSSDFAPAAYSVSWWSKIPSSAYANTSAVLGKDSISNGRQFLFGVNNGKAYAEHNGGNSGLATANTGVADDNNWHHFAIVFTGGTWSALYQDGASVPFTIGGAGSPVALVDQSSQPLNIGRRAYPGSESYFTGLLDDIGFFNRVLTAAEVAKLYNAGFQGAMI